MTKTCFQIYKRSSPILRRSGSLRTVPKFQWERYRKEIIGYMYVDDMLVIIQGKKAKKYINRKKEFKVITIGVYPPSCESDWSYWQYTLTGNDVIKKKHITKTPHIF